MLSEVCQEAIPLDVLELGAPCSSVPGVSDAFGDSGKVAVGGAASAGVETAVAFEVEQPIL